MKMVRFAASMGPLALVSLLACGQVASAPAPPPTPAATPPTPAATPPTPTTPPTPAAAPAAAEPRIISSDGDWNTLSILDDTYRVSFPGMIRWEISPPRGQKRYTMYQATKIYNGRVYELWVQRYPPGDARLADPAMVDDACAAFVLASQGVSRPRMDFPVGRGLATGRAARYTFTAGGNTTYGDLVVFRVDNDLIFISIKSRPTHAPIAHFRRMVEGFSRGAPNP